MMGDMQSLADVFSLWPTIPEMAVDVGESHWAIRKWKQRGRIPSTAWPALVDAARRKGKHLSTDDLLAMHASSSSAA